jgi:hypothetical protein
MEYDLLVGGFLIFVTIIALSHLFIIVIVVFVSSIVL